MRTQKALEQAAAEIKRLREQQRLLTAGAGAGQKAAAEAAVGWQREREEVRGFVWGFVWWVGDVCLRMLVEARTLKC